MYPLGALSTKFHPSPSIGFWVRTKVEERYSIDAGFSFYVPRRSSEFDYTIGHQIYKLDAKGFSGMVGTRFSRNFSLDKNFDLVWDSSVGYAFFMYDDRYQRGIDKEDGTYNGNSGYTKGFSTIHLGQGLKLNYKNVGLQVQYQFTPYSLFYSELDNDFGSQALTVGLYYRQ
jgi:hypothetical protein